MIRYKCKIYDIDTKEKECRYRINDKFGVDDNGAGYSECRNCNYIENVDVNSDIYWCPECNVPLYEKICPVCASVGKRIATDVRPVFPAERLLVELIWDEPFKYRDSSVWCTSSSSYILDGKVKKFSVANISDERIEEIRTEFGRLLPQNDDAGFLKYKRRFVACNRGRFEEIDKTALSYIQNIANKYDQDEMFVSFSGGKDSTVTSDLVMRALNFPKLLHIFGDTTLEFDLTQEYVKRFKKNHPGVLLLSSRNKEKDFNQLCELLGPPSRVMRWCCTIFKTGAINRKIDQLFKDKKRILAFYGIRRSESTSRSKYEQASEGRKIARQLTVSPIIDWLDMDIWLYILTMNIDFNEAYTLGYSRVGCWCCPNNSGWSEFLSKIFMKESYDRWHEQLVKFAKSIGKPDPEVYVNTGRWKARQGGNGLAYAGKSVISFEECALEDNAFNYELQKPISEELYELFKPFGYIDKVRGNERLGEVIIVNRTGKDMLKLQGRIGSTHLKVSILDYHLDGAVNVNGAEDKVKCQLTKYQMCMGCKACEGVCRHGAISVVTDKNNNTSYRIDDDKCVRCAECVNHFIAGCYIRKVLAIKNR